MSEKISVPTRIIRPSGGWNWTYWQDLWSYRELFWFLAWRDILIRYKQTVLGVLWVILQPLINVVVFTLLFGQIAKLDNQGIPYPLITLTGSIIWQFFANSLTFSGTSLLSSSNLISKVYFPRLIIPLSAMLACLMDAGVSLLLLLLVHVGYWIAYQCHWIEGGTYVLISWRLLFLPLIVLWIILLTGGFSIALAALNARYRDVKYVVPYFLRVGLLISPVGYLTSVIPEKWYGIFILNPLVGVTDAFRWVFFGEAITLSWFSIGIGIGITFISLIGSTLYFQQTERDIADII